MSQKTSAFEPTIRRLERHAAESIDEDTDLLAVVQEFDFSTAEVYEVGETEWNARYGYEPMVRAFYCKELVGFTTEELHEYLADADYTLGHDFLNCSHRILGGSGDITPGQSKNVALLNGRRRRGGVRNRWYRAVRRRF